MIILLFFVTLTSIFSRSHEHFAEKLARKSSNVRGPRNRNNEQMTESIRSENAQSQESHLSGSSSKYTFANHHSSHNRLLSWSQTHPIAVSTSEIDQKSDENGSMHHVPALQNSNLSFNNFGQRQILRGKASTIFLHADPAGRILQGGSNGSSTSTDSTASNEKNDSVITPGMFFDPEQLNQIQKHFTSASSGQMSPMTQNTSGQSNQVIQAKKNQGFRSSYAFTFRFGS